MIEGREIVLGVTGGIAVYRAAELVRLLIKAEASVSVVMTKSAAEFVSPLTFQTLSQKPVALEMFETEGAADINHISLADRAHLMLVAPATANIIGKMANGIADDLLSTTLMATKAPVLIAPAMNTNMWEHPALQANMEILHKRGVLVVTPGVGDLACGWKGPGRLADLEDIMEAVECALSHKDLQGIKVMVTSGPTRELIDPVRYITNRSSGKMGYAIATVARRRGAEVCLISGPTALRPPSGVRMINVATAREMLDVALAEAEKADIVVKASAVADYRPIRSVTQKIKKKDGPLILELQENPDILYEIGQLKGDRILIGFAAETSDLIKNAKTKLKKKNLDLIVANDVTRAGAGFDHDTNIVKIIDTKGNIEEWEIMSKLSVAEKIFDKIQTMITNKKTKKKK